MIFYFNRFDFTNFGRVQYSVTDLWLTNILVVELAR